MERSETLQQMYVARSKLAKVIQLQEKLEYGLLDADAAIYNLTEQQKTNYIAESENLKTLLINELVGMMNAYLQAQND